MRQRAALALLAVIMATASLEADIAVGAGITFLGFGVGLGLAPAVLLIEAVIAHRIFRGLGFASPLWAVFSANLASSILGVVVMEFAPLSFRGRGPIDEPLRMMLALSIPFFIFSVLVEGVIAKRAMPSKFHPRVWRWAFEANLVSYIIIVAVLLITLRAARDQGLTPSIW